MKCEETCKMNLGYSDGTKILLDCQCYAPETCPMRQRIAKLEAELDAAAESSPDDIRAQGWVVAIHNDYRLNDVPHTFWLFTKGGHCVKGAGKTDAEALNEARAILAPGEPSTGG